MFNVMECLDRLALAAKDRINEDDILRLTTAFHPELTLGATALRLYGPRSGIGLDTNDRSRPFPDAQP
jgi:hypothetical protein